jgi:hypothetical protein
MILVDRDGSSVSDQERLPLMDYTDERNTDEYRV